MAKPQLHQYRPAPARHRAGSVSVASLRDEGLSVDIDVVFIDHTLGREEALQAIGEDLLASKSLISKMGYRASLPASKSGDDVNLLVEAPDARVKVEVNFVFRGTVLPTVRARLCDRAQHVFTTDVEVPMLDTAELYGSKLVAAMDRQHPRDMFDVSTSSIENSLRSSSRFEGD